VFIQDRLFATLDTTTRAWEVAPGKRVFLSDTVGFISDLPHHLVSSFLATLEEARQADLLLHVVDAADPDALEHVEVVEQTLARIDAGGVPRIAVLNQIDRVRDPVALRLLAERFTEPVVKVSAVSGEGLLDLARAVLAYATRRDLHLTLEVDPGAGALLARLREWGHVEEVTYPDEKVRVRLRLPSRYLATVQAAGARVLEGLPAPEPGHKGEDEREAEAALGGDGGPS
jgi:GTP-binding protein HflX